MIFTAKNGDPPGAGKIWENRFLTGKMGQQGPKCTQMDEDTCQGFRGAGRNFFSFTIQAVALTFPKVCSQFAPRGPKFTWISSVQLISYFSLIFSTFFHHLLYSAQLWQALQEWSFCTGNTTKLWLFNFFSLNIMSILFVFIMDFQYFDAIFHNISTSNTALLLAHR